jgi:hypothetical protein
MTMKWLFDSIKDHTKKLWRFKVIGGFQPQQFREDAYLAPTLGRETKGYLIVGWGPAQSPRGLYG